MQRSCSSDASDNESNAVAKMVSRCAANLAQAADEKQHEKLCRMGSCAQQQAAAQAGDTDDTPVAHALDMAWKVRHSDAAFSLPCITSLWSVTDSVCLCPLLQALQAAQQTLEQHAMHSLPQTARVRMKGQLEDMAALATQLKAHVG